MVAERGARTVKCTEKVVGLASFEEIEQVASKSVDGAHRFTFR